MGTAPIVTRGFLFAVALVVTSGYGAEVAVVPGVPVVATMACASITITPKVAGDPTTLEC